jgi:hypothetical protein
MLGLLMAAGDAFAFRCGGWLIETGNTKYEVGQHCGDPDSSEFRTEWRPQTVFQMQCQTFMDPVPAPGGAAGGRPAITYRPRTVCNPFPLTITVPVEVEIWFYDDASVPKALHFENGRLVWIEPLWGLRRG